MRWYRRRHRPSAVAVERLRRALRADVGELEVQLEEGLLRCEALLALGQPQAAARVLDQQRQRVASLSARLADDLAAAAVEREAEAVLAACHPERAPAGPTRALAAVAAGVLLLASMAAVRVLPGWREVAARSGGPAATADPSPHPSSRTTADRAPAPAGPTAGARVSDAAATTDPVARAAGPSPVAWWFRHLERLVQLSGVDVTALLGTAPDLLIPTEIELPPVAPLSEEVGTGDGPDATDPSDEEDTGEEGEPASTSEQLGGGPEEAPDQPPPDEAEDGGEQDGADADDTDSGRDGLLRDGLRGDGTVRLDG